MSLINDMLRDLDARRTRTGVSQAAALQGLGLSGPLQPASRTRVPATLAIIGMICMTVLAWPIVTNYNANSDRTMLTAGSSLPLPLPEIDTNRKAAARKSRQERAIDSKPEAVTPAIAPQAATQRQAHAAPEVQPAVSTPEVMAPVSATPGGERDQPRTNRNELPVDNTPEATLSSGYEPKTAALGEVRAVPEPAGMPVSRVTRQAQTVEMQVAREYRAAVAHVQSQQYTESVRRLQQVLAMDDAHHKARLLLAQLHIRLQEHARAEALLADGLARHPGNALYARQYARLMIDQGSTETALLALETALPEAGNDAEYLALLAGLYQRAGKAAEAAIQYRAALQLAPDRGDWWMGLGISEEQAGRTEAARQAYEQSLRYPLKASLKDYVISRLRRLPPAGIS